MEKTFHFPEGFQWGTSSAAYQIETAFEHDWLGVKSRDGYIFESTCDHEKRREEDAEIIASIAPHYRMSVMWSKLQRAPYREFEPEVVKEYQDFLELLHAKGVKIMMVLHHFTNPVWFSQSGGWTNPDNIPVWIDFCEKTASAFGRYVSCWNTFNEPNVYAVNAFLLGNFPPFQKSISNVFRVVRNMADAHRRAYAVLKAAFPEQPVGISHNAVVFYALNVWGKLPAYLADRWYMEYMPSCFEPVDFFGMSYYARIGFEPGPVTQIDAPEKISRYQLPHDQMWEYYPEGLGACIRRYWKQYRKPILITENGICTDNDAVRVKAIREYLQQVAACIAEGIPVKGYYFWSTFDNYEWNLGPTYRFGLYECSLEDKTRTKRPSADFYSDITKHNRIVL